MNGPSPSPAARVQPDSRAGPDHGRRAAIETPAALARTSKMNSAAQSANVLPVTMPRPLLRCGVRRYFGVAGASTAIAVVFVRRFQPRSRLARYISAMNPAR